MEQIDQENLEWARAVALMSKDTSTKVGAFICNPNDGVSHSFGYNGIPRGLNDADPKRLERPEKYLWMEHAERNAVFNAVRSILSGKLLLTNEMLDIESARAIVSTGISHVLIKNRDALCYRIEELFREGGVSFYDISDDIPKKWIQFYGLTESLSVIRKKDFGTLILDRETYAPVSKGVSGFSFGVTPDMLNNFSMEEQKNLELSSSQNAIYNAARRIIQGASVYATFAPCMQCAKALVASGVKRVVSPAPNLTQDRDVRWKEEQEISKRWFSAAGIQLILKE